MYKLRIKDVFLERQFNLSIKKNNPRIPFAIINKKNTNMKCLKWFSYDDTDQVAHKEA